RLAAPQAVHLGDTISLAVTVASSARVPGQLTVFRDGSRHADSQVIQLRDGETPYTLSYTAGSPGWHSFRGQVHLNAHTVPLNNGLGVPVAVGPRRRVAVVSTWTSRLAPLLAARGMRVQAVPPQSLPTSAAGYDGLDALVLENVPAADLAAAQITALDAAVR